MYSFYIIYVFTLPELNSCTITADGYAAFALGEYSESLQLPLSTIFDLHSRGLTCIDFRSTPPMNTGASIEDAPD